MFPIIIGFFIFTIFFITDWNWKWGLIMFLRHVQWLFDELVCYLISVLTATLFGLFQLQNKNICFFKWNLLSSFLAFTVGNNFHKVEHNRMPKLNFKYVFLLNPVNPSAQINFLAQPLIHNKITSELVLAVRFGGVPIVSDESSRWSGN